MSILGILGILGILAYAALPGTQTPVNTAPVMRTIQVGPPPTANLLRFADVPNVAITYYDVTGDNIAEIHRAVAKAAPRDPTTRVPTPATSSWTVGVKVKTLTTNKRCRITGVTLDFRGVALMPRLIPGKETTPQVIAIWNAYLRRLEARQAEQLRFAYDRIGTFEKAIVGNRCDRTGAATDAAFTRVRDEQRLAFKPETSRPRLEEPPTE